MISRDAIEAADRRIKELAGGVVMTPLLPSGLLSSRTGARVHLKCEHLQNTGSFKLRGALSKLTLIDERQAREGVIAASSGNHGLAVSHGASLLGLDATVYVPETASNMKVDAIAALGAEIVKVPGEPLQSELAARRAAEEQGQVFVSPYNDLDVIAGQGTIGLELAAQCQDLDAVFVSVGGGGLISGIGSYLKATMPNVEIVAAWPERARTLFECLEAGKIITVEEDETLSDGTAGGVEEGSVSFPIAREVIDAKILVSEDEIASAMRLVAETERWMIEGAAGVAVAAFLQQAESYKDKNVAVVICGRNISLAKFLEAVA